MSTMSGAIKHVFFVSVLPLALAATPAGRWGHQAVYVPSQQAMYVVGGQVSSTGSKITNDVLIMPLNQTSPSFSAGPNDALPPHAFAAATLSEGGESLMVIGGMTSSCSSDAIAHVLTLDGSTTSWAHASPNSLVRRRGAAAAWTDNGSANGQVLLVGGVADTYSCSTGTYTYPATDLLDIPLSASALRSSTDLASGLTSSDLAVSDFAFARASDGTLYMIGGQDASGKVVPLNTIGKWTTADGWVSQTTSGSAPSGRVGAALVAHPTLDLLIMHGGEVNNAASTTLAFLNTTSWEWSLPYNLQPPASSAAAYHSNIMTPHGVMISTFGLGSTGSPSSNVFYLDMRDTTQSTWSWKSQWSSDMLNAYTAPTDNGKTPITGVADSAKTGDNGSDKKKITSIVVPVIIGALILIPLAVWYIRRKIRLNRKRRMARHFAFEDEGEFRSTTSLPPGRVTRTQYGFGTDANEREGNLFTDAFGAIKRLSTRRRSVDSDSSTGEREMVQVRDGRVTRLDERTMRWEEIDFGLGQVDQNNRDSRQNSFNGPDRVASTAVDPFADPAPLIRLESSEASSDHAGTPLNDGQQPLIPSLVLQPPTVPPTPASGMTAAGQTFNPSNADGLDWNLLAQEMQVRPAFRSISPTSTLRSHSHSTGPTIVPARSTSPAGQNDDDTLPYLRSTSPPPYGPLAPGRLPPVDTLQSSSGSQIRTQPPRLPSLDFQRSSVTFDPTARRASDAPPPVSFPHPRAVSQPVSARHLAGAQARRGSAPLISVTGESTSGEATPIARSPRALPATPEQKAVRRASNPGTPGTFGAQSPKSPRSPKVGSPGLGSPLSLNDKRASTMSRLRVMNMTDEDESSVESSEAK